MPLFALLLWSIYWGWSEEAMVRFSARYSDVWQSYEPNKGQKLLILFAKFLCCPSFNVYVFLFERISQDVGSMNVFSFFNSYRSSVEKSWQVRSLVKLLKTGGLIRKVLFNIMVNNNESLNWGLIASAVFDALSNKNKYMT